MKLGKPSIEFVGIDLNDNIMTSGEPGYETCVGKPAASNNCLADGVFWLNNTPEEPECSEDVEW